MDSGNPIKIKN